VSSIQRLIRRAGGPKSIGTVFDVGAHDGADSLVVAEHYPDIRLVAIEPTPELAEALRQKSAHLSNYTVVEAAVSSDEGRRVLNVFADAPELNSLNQLNSAATSFVGRTSPHAESHRLVVTKRLSTICDELGIETVDVLHIDTQGSDLDVMRSLDERRLQSVRAGAIEVSYRVRLYETSQYGEEARSVLEEMGFRVFRIERLHYLWDTEQNYYFVRRSVQHRWPTLERVVYKAHLLACDARAFPGRYLVRPMQRLRVALAIRTRLRRLMRE
jgi:FkbM family methyltransferase